VVVNVQPGAAGQQAAVATTVPAEPRTVAEFCPQCGKRRDGTLSFCRNCGAKLT
jgi:membrane protease subunit (stomatin/prohibitin family)